ncbi:MAG TPA: DUF4399 domain-containing protein [Acetobacteraceae bacterium]|nr:DUF4399 domain-containing protein [Acetobacteraceae bacterium]
MTTIGQVALLVALGAATMMSGPAGAQTPAPSPPPPAAAPSPAPAAAAPATPAPKERTPAPHDAYVYIGWPNDGEVIRSTRFKVWFGTRNFGVAPSGTFKPNTGHHHLLIDTDLPPMDQPIPNDKKHLHFGGGQTEAIIELAPGKHTLQLLMGDGNHVPHDPPLYSKKITIYVRPD